MPKRINQTRDEGVSGDRWEKVLGDFAGHVYHAGDWRKLADEAGVSYATVENIAYRQTKSPHMRTVINIMNALGRGDELEKALHTNSPLSQAEAIKLRPAHIKRRYKKAAERAEALKAEREEKAAEKKRGKKAKKR